MPDYSSPSNRPKYNAEGDLIFRKNIWFTEKVWEEIDVLSVEHSESPSEVVERLLRFWMEHHPEDYEGVEL